jgi:hypothetical protein
MTEMDGLPPYMLPTIIINEISVPDLSREHVRDLYRSRLPILHTLLYPPLPQTYQ